MKDYFQLSKHPFVRLFNWHSFSLTVDLSQFSTWEELQVWGPISLSFSLALSPSRSLLNLAGDRFPSWGKVFRWLMLRTAESMVLPSVLAPKHCWQDLKNCSLRTDEAAGRRTSMECAVRSRQVEGKGWKTKTACDHNRELCKGLHKVLLYGYLFINLIACLFIAWVAYVFLVFLYAQGSSVLKWWTPPAG